MYVLPVKSLRIFSPAPYFVDARSASTTLRVTVHALVTASRNAGGVSRHPALVYTPTLRRRAKRVDHPTSYNQPQVTVHALGSASRNAGGVSRHHYHLSMPKYAQAQFMPLFYVHNWAHLTNMPRLNWGEISVHGQRTRTIHE